MSKRFLDPLSLTHSDIPSATPSDQKEKEDQVAVLYELGLLTSSREGSKSSRRRKADRGKEIPGAGGAHGRGFHSKKGTQPVRLLLLCFPIPSIPFPPPPHIQDVDGSEAIDLMDRPVGLHSPASRRLIPSQRS